MDREVTSVDDRAESGHAVPGQGRPTGVWIVTVGLGWFAGVSQLLWTVGVISIRSTVADVSGGGLFMGALLGVAIVISAVAAWRGNNWGRYALVAFATVYYGMVSAYNLMLLEADPLPDSRVLQPHRLWARVVRGPVTVAVSAWYLFGSQSARDFYRRGSR